MPDHCIHEADWGAMRKTVAHLEKEIDGNGTPGLGKTVPVLADNVKDLTNAVKDLQTGVSGLLRFQEGMVSVEKQKNKTFINIIKVLGVIIAFASLLFTTIEMNKKTRNIVDQYGYDMVTRGGFINDTL